MSTVSKIELNVAVQKLGKIDRTAAVEILARYKVTNTAVLPEEHWQAVHAACVAALAKLAVLP